MEKLELKHIQHYPIGGDNALKILFKDEIHKVVGLNGDYYPTVEIRIDDNIARYASIKIIDIKPILRPMSYLCKPLENGTYPIAVIGRMYESKGKLYCEDGIYSYGWNTHVCDDYQGYEIGWIEDVGWFGIFYDAYDINNQSKNFTGDYIPFNRSISNYLDENKFDWRNRLIDKKLAIDCNELKTNKD